MSNRGKSLLLLVLIFIIIIMFYFVFIKKSHGEEKSVYDFCQNVLISPTPIITDEPSATPSGSIDLVAVRQAESNSSQPEGNNSTTNPPGDPSCTIPFAAPTLQGYQKSQDGLTQTYSWWLSTAQGITKQTINYGYSKDNLEYGAGDLSANITYKDIQGLDPKRISYAQVCAWKGQCDSCSAIVN